MKYLLALVVYPLLVLQEVSACYKCGVSYADPHIQTFDANKFQCQGQGDFVLSKATKSDFELQARFFVPEKLHSGRNGSSTVGAVLNTGVGSEGKIEVQVTPAGFPASSEHDCDIHYYVNGVRKVFNSWDVQDRENRFLFKRRTRQHKNPRTGQRYSIPFRQFYMYDSKVILWMSKGFDSVFGCYMNMQMCVPCDFDQKHDLVGLFGSPDGDKTNDFTTPAGEQIERPPKLGEQTTYCRENWCVGNQEQSHFLLPDIREQCASDPADQLDELVENADDEIKSECEGEVDCISDTIVTGDVEIGKKTLEGERDLKEHDIEEETEPTENDKVEEDDAYTCTKAGVGSETAFARPADGSGCFLEDDAFNRWGWTIEIDGTSSSSNTYDVYAGAGQCETSKGELVGLVTVQYDAATKKCTGEYTSTGGYTIQEIQFYCGGGKYPLNKQGKGTVAPGAYSVVQAETASPTNALAEVDGVEPSGGKIYAIAHAVSCDAKETDAPDPTLPPTAAPSSAPTNGPTSSPTGNPTKRPTSAPTSTPSAGPTGIPTLAPTEPESECPEKMVAFNDACHFEGECSYGTEVCCDGSTHSEYIMTCDKDMGTAQGFHSDACLAVTCDDSDSPDDRSHLAPPKVSEEDTVKDKGSGSGDPHFKTWTGDKYDYHGECDLVLVDNPTFADGLGLRVHIRTTRVKYFSFIEKVAVQIGKDTLEFDNDVENFLINGAKVEENRKHHKTHLGGFFIRRDKRAISIRLEKEGKAKIDLHTRMNGFPAVIVDGGSTDIFKGSLGLLGDWETGKRLARDGKTELNHHDATAFALEWQVSDMEPLLFTDARFPQFPTMCTPPAKRDHNRLGSSFEMEAEKACAHWKEDKEDCIFDVIATRDVLVAAEGHLVHVE